MAKRRKNQQNKAAAQQQSQPNAAQEGTQAANQTASTTQAPNSATNQGSCNNNQTKYEEAKQGNGAQGCKNCQSTTTTGEAIDCKEQSTCEADSMMVQPNFNISETVEVVHMGPQGHQNRQKNNTANANANATTRFQQEKQQMAANSKTAATTQQTFTNKPQPVQKQAPMWNQGNMGSQNAQFASQQKRQYTQPPGKQPVVTMHDLIDQQEQLNSEQQKAQRQQAAAQQQQQQHQQQNNPPSGTPQQQQQQQQQHAQQDMGTEADDEEGEEESEEEDTEEEGNYGAEEGQEDDLSDEIEDEQQWDPQNPVGGQFRPAQGAYPGQGNQPNQQDANSQFYGGANGAQGNGQQPHYANGQGGNTQQQSQQHYQQHAQGHHPQQQQRSQAQQNAENVENRLHQYLTDMLINLYNGKGTEEYREHYAHVVTILDDQKKFQEINNEQCSITINSLQQLFTNKIESIVGTVRDKLQEDAKKDNLVMEVEGQTVADAQQQDSTQTTTQGGRRQGQAANAVQKPMKAKDYRGDLQKNFDEILSAVGDYFDLFKNNTDKLEALWLQLLDYVDVKNTNQCRIFRRMHYAIYIRIVINNTTIQAIINEASNWTNTPQASKMLKEHLDKIKQIQNDSHPIPETYENFNKRGALDFNLNTYTKTDFEQKQALERQQQSQQQRTTNAEGSAQASSSVCNKTFNDCNQFQMHQRQNQGRKCMCQCYAKTCVVDHCNSVFKGPRGTTQKRGGEKRQNKKFDAQNADFDYTDEKVYNKNLDDLMDYINQPQAESKKNKKKAKKRKEVADTTIEEDIKVKNQSVQSSSNGSNIKPAPSQQTASNNSSAPSQQRKKQGSVSSNGQNESSSDKDGAPRGEVRSTSRPKKAAQEQSSQTQPSQRQPSQTDSQQWPDSATASSGYNSNEGQLFKSDKDFEQEIEDFAKQLERNCAAKLANHAKKLRPNYEEKWILKLKCRLQTLENKRQNSATTSSSQGSSSKTAPPASSGNGRKH